MFNFLKRKIIKKINSDELLEQMTRYSEEYIDFIEQKSEQPRLDYNIGNLEIVEIALDQAEKSKNDISDDKKSWIVSRTSAYISEIARMNFGGRYYWNSDLNIPVLVIGEPKYKLHLLTYNKVIGRIEKGIEDNIPFFFNGFIGNMSEAKKGDEKYII